MEFETLLILIVVVVFAYLTIDMIWSLYVGNKLGKLEERILKLETINEERERKGKSQK